MNTLKSIEDLKAELAIAEQKLYEEKQAVLKAEREEKYRLEKIAQEVKDKEAMLKWEAVAKEIVKELKAVGFSNANYIMEDKGEYPAIRCFAADNYSAWRVEFDTSYSSNYGRAGVTQIKVGQYGEANRYPQLKAGGFNYKKIAATAWDKYQTALAKKKRANTEEENKAANEARITRLKNQFGKKPYDSATHKEIDNVKVSYYTHYDGDRNRGGHYTYRTDDNLMLSIDSISEEQAAKLIQFMIENGMTEKK